jgi:LysR family transcriptional regulator, transcriptional activator of nhaA
MIRWLNYHHLLYFRSIAKEGSIAKASEVLRVGQPALSTQLKQLEESLGQKLFERKNKSLILTAAGKVALAYADEIFMKGEEFVQVFNQQNLDLKSHYRIGVIPNAPKILACRMMEMAQKLGNNCFVSMTEATPEVLVQKVDNHELDIALTTNISVTSKEDLMIKSLGTAYVSVYGSEKFQKLIARFPDSLKGQPFILPTKHTKLRYDLESIFHELRLHYDLVAEVQDSAVKKMMAEHGKGLVFLPEFAAKPLEKEEKIFKIGRFKNLQEEYWLVAAKRTISSDITERLLKSFKLFV